MIRIGRLGPSDVRRLYRELPGLEVLVAAAFVLTVIALPFGDALTIRTFTIGPGSAGKLFDSYWYSDESNGGTSKIVEVRSRPLAWSCNLTRTYEYGYCGFGMLFDRKHDGSGIDFSGFDSIKLKVNYSGPGDLLRVSVKNQDPRYKFPDGSVVDKVNQASVGVRQGRQILNLELANLDVPEWWKDQTQATGAMARPEYHNVIGLEVLTGVDSAVGEHRIAIDEVVLEGRLFALEAWYGAIGGLWLFLIACLLIHRRVHRERMRRQLAATWRTTLDTIPQMVWCSDQHGTLFNGRWEDFTGVPVGRHRADPYRLVHRGDRRAALATFRRSLETGCAFEMELRLMHHSGGYRWVLAQAVPARDEKGAILGWYAACTDVHERIVAEEALQQSVKSERLKSDQLKWASEHDALTGLPNRRAFQARLESACARVHKTGGEIGLLLIDLDHFKHVNDTLGHSAGDGLLKALSERLKGAVRKNGFVARVGGDEFAVIVDSVCSDHELLNVAERLCDQMRAPIRLDGRALSSGASIGGARFPKDAPSADDLFKAADTALYALKDSGRGGTKLFDPALMEEADRAASQLNLARLAINEESVVPVYQPKIELKTGAVAGFEALLRWKRAGEGLQLPDGLSEAFKDYELAARIGETMQRKVASDIRDWRKRGLPLGRVSINASPAEFLRDDYAERLLGILESHDLPGECVEVEVTEHALMERSAPYVGRAIGLLKESGVSVSLDDFGTGYSSLSHLRDFPVDLVKIDRSFVQQMLDNQEIAAIVAAVVTLARSLDIDVVAEGVEDGAQLALLRSLGCRFAQGRLLGEPVQAAAAEQLMAAAKVAA